MEHFTHPRQVAKVFPDKIAYLVADTEAAITYRDLVTRSDQAAHLYARMGLKAGDTYAVLLENQIQYAEVCWAGKNSQLRYVALSTHLNAADAAYIIKDSGAKLLVTSRAQARLAQDALRLLDFSLPVLAVDGVVDGFEDYDTLIQKEECSPLPGRWSGMSMLYSSGTTGRPKGIKTQIVEGISPEAPPPRFSMMEERFEFGSDMIFYSPAPMYHAGPLRFMFSCQRSGGTYISQSKFDAQKALEVIEQHRVTHGFFVPTMFSRMLALPETTKAKFDLSSMRYAIHAAAPCPPDVKRRMIDWWGPVIEELYSGTEAVGHTFISSEEWLKHPGSVGKPHSTTKIKIVDGNGAEQPPGQPGLIMMCNGRQVEYHGAASQGNPTFQNDDGFASLGDVGYLDKDGYLYLTDRASDMIIVGGVNIYPQEAEAVLCQHPNVEDAAVFGVPHEDLGEEVKAVVLPKSWPENEKEFEQELLRYCHANLSKNKCPNSIDFRRDLPRSEMGKMIKRKLREEYWQGRGRMI